MIGLALFGTLHIVGVFIQAAFQSTNGELIKPISLVLISQSAVNIA